MACGSAWTSTAASIDGDALGHAETRYRPLPGLRPPLGALDRRFDAGGLLPGLPTLGRGATYWPPILADRTIYRVLVAPNAHPSAAQVRAVAGVSGENFLRARQVLAGPPTALFAGRAEAV